MDHAQAGFPKGLKGLIVDDHDLIRKSVARVLRRLAFDELFECFNIKDARTIIDTQNVDLLICDLEVNQMSSLEILEHVRSLDTRSDIPVIIVTGTAEKDDIIKAADKGAEEYLVKPFQAEDLEAKVIKVLTQYHSPGPILSRIRQAEKHIRDGAFTEAQALIQEALDMKDSARARHLQALLLLKQQDHEGAIVQLISNIQKTPQYLKNYVTLANLYIERKDSTRAIEALTQELTINPKQPLRQIKLGNMLLKEGLITQAIEHYRFALLENGRNAEALYGMGTAHALAENLEKAIYYFKRYRRHHPKDTRPLKAIVQFAGEQDPHRLAELALLDEKKSHPERMDTYIILAEMYRKQTAIEKALNTLESAIKRKPDFASAHVMLAHTFKQQNDMDSAIKAIQRFVNLSKDPQAYILLAQFFFEAGKPSLTISTLHQGLAANADLHVVLPLLLQATLKTKQLAKSYFIYQHIKILELKQPFPPIFDQIDTLLKQRRKSKTRSSLAS